MGQNRKAEADGKCDRAGGHPNGFPLLNRCLEIHPDWKLNAVTAGAAKAIAGAGFEQRNMEMSVFFPILAATKSIIARRIAVRSHCRPTLKTGSLKRDPRC